LTDEDRWPWLDSLRKLISGLVAEGQDAVIACSALKQEYRDRLQQGDKEIVFAYLKGDYEMITNRLAVRQDHFMNPDLLVGQLSTLEEPQMVLTVGIDRDPSEIVRAVKEGLNL